MGNKPLGRDPLFVVKYGQPGTMKTVDTLNAYGSGVYFVTSHRGELKVATTKANVSGVTFGKVRHKVLPHADLPALTKFLKGAAKPLKGAGIRAISLDPFTIFTDAEFDRLFRPVSEGGEGIDRGYAGVERELGARVMEFADFLIDFSYAVGVDIVLSGHENNGYMQRDDGSERFGGPAMKGSFASQQLMRRSDVFTRVLWIDSPIEATSSEGDGDDLRIDAPVGPKKVCAMILDETREFLTKTRVQFPRPDGICVIDPARGWGMRQLVEAFEQGCRA